MPDHRVDARENRSERLQTNHNTGKLHEGENRIVIICRQILDQGDSFIYAIGGVCFFLGALFTLGYSFWDFGSTILMVPSLAAQQQITEQSVVAGAIIKLVSDLLLVFIIMEVLGTVIYYFKGHATSLRPFLFIGIFSSTRGILFLCAKLFLVEVKGGEFTNVIDW